MANVTLHSGGKLTLTGSGLLNSNTVHSSKLYLGNTEVNADSGATNS